MYIMYIPRGPFRTQSTNSGLSTISKMMSSLHNSNHPEHPQPKGGTSCTVAILGSYCDYEGFIDLNKHAMCLCMIQVYLYLLILNEH